VLVRRETPDDVDPIDEVHRHAFAFAAADGAEPVEVALVHSLRADRGWVPALSLVAEDAQGAVVGHVVCSEGALGDTPAVGLGPIGVRPDVQRSGVGRALMHAVLAAADALDYPLVALLGHLDYYRQFGFVPATAMGVLAPDPAWGDHFQARPLAAWRPALKGAFRYAAPFEAL
jgi:putative acetyltransferase